VLTQSQCRNLFYVREARKEATAEERVEKANEEDGVGSSGCRKMELEAMDAGRWNWKKWRQEDGIGRSEGRKS
jgi:hypothetical protein